MRLVDTSAWIEFLIGSETGMRVRQELPQRSDWVVPTIVQYELIRWMRRETDDDRADRMLAFTMRCTIVPLDTGLALAAVEDAHSHGLAMADAIVYATGRTLRAPVLTCDAHFAGLPDVIHIAKTGGS